MFPYKSMAEVSKKRVNAFKLIIKSNLLNESIKDYLRRKDGMSRGGQRILFVFILGVFVIWLVK